MNKKLLKLLENRTFDRTLRLLHLYRISGSTPLPQGLFTNFASCACYKNLVESMVYIIGILHNVLQYKLLSSNYRLSHRKTFPFRLTQLYWMLTWRRMKLLRWFRSQLEAWDVSEDERLTGVLSTMSGSSKFHIELPRPKNAKNDTRDSCILNRLIISSVYSTKYHTICNTKSNNLHVTTSLGDASSWVTLANGNGSCTKNGLRFQQTPPSHARGQSCFNLARFFLFAQSM